MPLSPPAPREHVHTRTVEVRGYRREDGLWDIEGHLVDVKTYSFENRDRGEVEAGEPIHGMWLRLTIDDDMLVHESEAWTEYGPYNLCGDVTPAFRQLKGLKIGPGWRRQVHALVGGAKGCTHLVELLGPMATTAYQTLFSKAGRRRERKPGERPAFLGTCHAYAPDSPIVKRLWPDQYTGPDTDEAERKRG